MDYEVSKGAAKGTKAGIGTVVALTVAAVVARIAKEQGIEIPQEAIVAVLAPILAFGLEMLRNWLKVRGILTLP